MALLRRRLFDDFDELFNVVFVPGGDLAANVSEDKDNVYVQMHVPGIIKDKIDITVKEDHLMITGSREEAQETKDKSYVRKEIRYGAFERIIPLPCVVDKDKTMAKCSDGVLEITLPKKKAGEETKKIKVS